MTVNFDDYQNIIVTGWSESARGLPILNLDNYRNSDLVLVKTNTDNIYNIFKDRIGNNTGKDLYVPSHIIAKCLLKG